MPKQKIEVEVDIPDGWELVMRTARTVIADGRIFGRNVDGSCDFYANLIVVCREIPKLEFPCELMNVACDGICMDSDGKWKVCKRKPEESPINWKFRGEPFIDLLAFFPNITLPDLTREKWNKSWIPKPPGIEL